MNKHVLNMAACVHTKQEFIITYPKIPMFQIVHRLFLQIL